MVRPIDRAGLFDALPDACLVLTPDLVMADANPAFCALVDRTLEQLLGHRIPDVFTVDPDDPAAAQRLTRAYRRVLASRQPADVGVLRYDLLVRPTPAGWPPVYRPRYWSVCVVPVLDDAGEVVVLLQRVREVTDVAADLARALAPLGEHVDGPAPDLDVVAAAVTAAELAAALTAELAQVREAMLSRSVIEQAKGVLMGQRGCTADQAFALLVELSQQTNRKLRDVCHVLVAEHAAPAVAGCQPP